MYGVVDFRGTQPATTGGYPGLLALARQVVGERLLFARRGYPDELRLHLGTAVQGPGPKGRTVARGSYVLGTAASDWTFKVARLGLTLDSGDPSARGAAPLDEARLDELLGSAGGATVAGVEVDAHPFGYALSLAFSDGSVFRVVPTPEEAARPADGPDPAPVPDWELFTPYGRYLRVGPGPTWAYLPSDRPE